MGYLREGYKASVIVGVDEVTVNKPRDSDWSTIKLTVNGYEAGEVDLRSKQMAEHLHFMLGQMLEIGD